MARKAMATNNPKNKMHLYTYMMFKMDFGVCVPVVLFVFHFVDQERVCVCVNE